jgi:pimeloyl-ACP methyl ester carboxylesterase
MATFVFCHGAWGSAWAFRKMRPLMAAAGHALFVPSYTGMGERAHLMAPQIDLDTHIADVVGVMETEELTDVILAGFSYGGMVATGVADRVPDRLRRLVYVDAFVPRDGQSLCDLVGPDADAFMRRGADEEGDGWRVPPRPPPEDTSPEDLAWMMRHRGFQPIRTLDQPVRLTRGEFAGPRSYVLASKYPGAAFSRFAERAREEGWDGEAIASSHNPQVTAPDLLMAVMERLAGLRS